MKTPKNKSLNALHRVQKHFPNVTSVVDAKEGVAVSVTEQDNSSGRRKDPKGCALARACVRTGKADGAIIGIAYSYLIKGDQATRYHTSVSVGREITSFDRHQDFAAGKDYLLSKVCKSASLGYRDKRAQGHGPRLINKEPPVVHNTKHRTSRIRLSKVK